MDRFQNKRNQCVLFTKVLLCALSLCAAVLKIFIGFDQDEGFVIAQACRLIQGDRLVRDLWEIYQTSTIFMYPFIKVFLVFTGSYDGIVIYLRMIATIIGVLIGLFTYKRMRLVSDEFIAFVVMVIIVNFEPRWTCNLEYGNLAFWFVLCHLCMIIDLKFCIGNSAVKSIFAGIFLSCAVLSYPTLLLLAVFSFIYLFRYNKKYICIVLVTCVACAIVFVGYVCIYISPADIIRSIPYILSDSSHTESRLALFVRALPKVTGRMLLLLIMSLVLKWCFTKINKIKDSKGAPLVSYSIIAGFLFIVLCNIIGGSLACGPFGFQDRYVLALILGIIFIIHSYNQGLNHVDNDCDIYLMNVSRNSNIDELAGFIIISGLIYYIAILLASNQPIDVNATALIISILGIFIYLSYYFNQNIIVIISIAVFAIGVILNKGYFVRVTGTGPANIFEKRVVIDNGPCSGIYVYPFDKTKYDRYSRSVLENSRSYDNVILLVSNGIYNLCVDDKCSYMSVTSHGTAKYDKQWIDYFTEFDHEYPDLIFIDSEKYSSIDDFIRESEFGRFMNGKCEMYFLE